jgi:predicted nucleotidyltransferase
MIYEVVNTGIKPEVLKQIAALAERNGVERVILFGSRARGDYRRESDIDLAVYGGDPALFHLALEEETDTLLCFDVVDMKYPLQPALAEAIQKEGRLLYEKV